MFAALGATNEAIMRAKSRIELFELVCEAAAVGGNFTSTAIVLDRPGADFLQNRRFRRTRSGAGQQGAIVGRCGKARRAGHHGHRVPYPRTVHQRRLSDRFRQLRAFLQGGSRQRNPIGCGVAAAARWQSRRRHCVSLQRTRRIQPRIDRTPAAPRRERLVRAGKFRSRRREGEDGGAEGKPDPHARRAQRDQ